MRLQVADPTSARTQADVFSFCLQLLQTEWLKHTSISSLYIYIIFYINIYLIYISYEENLRIFQDKTF